MGAMLGVPERADRQVSRVRSQLLRVGGHHAEQPDRLRHVSQPTCCCGESMTFWLAHKLAARDVK